MTHSINKVATVLLNEPDIYTWQKFEIGPKYTAERIQVRGEWKYEVQSKGGAHLTLVNGVEEAIIFVMQLDSQVTIPQDLEKIA